MSERPLNVLFLCTGNSARSVIAEAVLNKLGPPRFAGYSAGSQPKGAVNPHALALLRRLDYDVSKLRSKSWDEFSRSGAPRLDVILTLCDSAASETCPIWPGHPMTAHWGLPDPADVRGTEDEIALAFTQTHDALVKRIKRLIDLPADSLDQKALLAKLREIGMGDA